MNYRNQLANGDAANRTLSQNPQCLLVFCPFSDPVFYYIPAIFFG
jgi:hypothetical protein